MTRSTSLLLVLAVLALPMAAPAKTSDRNQRTNVDADSNDCSVNDTGPCVFAGNVVIDQGTLNILAARADIRRADGEIKTVKLTGSPVKCNSPNSQTPAPLARRTNRPLRVATSNRSLMWSVLRRPDVDRRWRFSAHSDLMQSSNLRGHLPARQRLHDINPALLAECIGQALSVAHPPAIHKHGEMPP